MGGSGPSSDLRVVCSPGQTKHHPVRVEVEGGRGADVLSERELKELTNKNTW
jgi:hypothetical protein